MELPTSVINVLDVSGNASKKQCGIKRMHWQPSVFVVKVTKGQKNRTDITIKLDLDSGTTVHDVIKELVLRSKELDIGNFTVKIEVDRNKKNKYKIKYVKSEWQ